MKDKVNSGLYNNASEVIRDSLLKSFEPSAAIAIWIKSPYTSRH